MKLAFKKALFRAAILASTLPYLTTSSYGMLLEEEGNKTSSSKLCQTKFSSNTITSFCAIERKIQRKKRNGSREPSQIKEVSSFASLYNLGQEVVQGDFLWETSTDGIAKAFYWWHRAQNQNDPEAWRELGKLYETGEGVEKNYSESMKCYLKAADQNNVEALYNIGWLYYRALGVKRDYVEAMKWYLKAAERNNANAQFMVGSLYEEGSEKIKKDSAEAIKWYLKAAAQNYSKALYRLWNLYCKDAENGHKAAFEYLQRVPLEMIDSHTFRDCNLTDIHASQVASLLSQTKHLKWISLSYNKFTSQGLKIILDTLQYYPNLLELSIDDNPIDDEGGKELLAFLQKHPSLEKISARGRFMGAHMRREIECSINRESALRTKPTRLHGYAYCNSFSNCDFTDQDAPQVASLLSQTKHLKWISFSYNKFTSQGLKIILNTLQSYPNLLELNVDNNPIDDEGGKELLAFLRKHPSLEKISARGRFTGAHVSREIEHSINRESALRTKPARLSGNSFCDSFSNCDFTDQDAPQVASLLSQTKDLKWITLSHNKFTSQGLKIILNTLQSYPNLLELNVYDNHIDDEGGKELLAFLQKHPSLEKISAHRNTHMSIEIERSINRESALRTKPARLSGNSFYGSCSNCDFTDQDAPQVASLLSQTKDLKWITLSHNKFTSQGLKIILNTLQSYPNLLELNVYDNLIDDEGGKELLSFIEAHSFLTECNVGDNPMSPQMQKSIEERIKKNETSI